LPRLACSRSIASNSALKLPLPKPCDPCRSISSKNLQRVLDAIVYTEGVIRSATLISLATQVRYRVLPLVRAAAAGARPRRS
jgi:hypothetical protein